MQNFTPSQDGSTIHVINFRELNEINDHEFKEFCRKVMIPDIISLFQQINYLKWIFC